MAIKNPFIATIAKSVIVLGNAQLAVEKAARNDIETLGDLGKADCNKLARLSGLPINHHAAIAAKAKVLADELVLNEKVCAAMNSEVSMKQGDNALLIKQYRAAMVVLTAAVRAGNIAEKVA